VNPKKEEDMRVITSFCDSPIKPKGPPPAFSGIDPEKFNKCINSINLLVNLTLRSKNSQMSQESYQRVIKLCKLLGFGQEITKKTQTEINQFLKTKDFLVILRVRIHILLNLVVLDQFNVN
jgi:hypothetical protein